MAKVTVLLVICTVLVAVNAYPVEENIDADSHSSSKVTPLLAAEAQQNQNESTKTQNSEGHDDSEQDSSESTEQTYIEETYIQVLLPGFPQLNATELDSLLNRTASQTVDDSKRNTDNKEDYSSLKDVSSPSSGSTVPPGLYSLRNSNSRLARSAESNEDSSSSEESSEKKSKVKDSSSSRKQTRKEKDNSSSEDDSSARDDSKENSSSSEESSEKKSKLRDSSSSSKETSTEKDNSSPKEEEKSKPNNSTTAAPTARSNSRQVREAVANKDNGDLNKQSPEPKYQPPKSTVATPALYSAQNFYSRPAREAAGKDDIRLSNGNSESSKTPSLPTTNTGQKRDSTETSSSRSNVAPALYSAHYSNVRKLREVVDSSEEKYYSDTTEGSVVYVTPQSKALLGKNNNEKEGSASASPLAAAEKLKLTS